MTSDPREQAARTPGVGVGPDGLLRDAHGPLDPATAEAEVVGHGGWQRGVVGVGVGLLVGLAVRPFVRGAVAGPDNGPSASV